MTYAKKARDQISGKDNLSENRAVLVDPKYELESSQDQKYTDAATVCKDRCEDRAKLALGFQNKTADNIKGIVQVRTGRSHFVVSVTDWLCSFKTQP